MMSATECTIFSEIGDIVVRLTEPNSDGAFFYAEATDGMASTALFKDIGSAVWFVSSLHELAAPIHQLWEAAPKDRKWAALFLTIQGKQFDARFQYPEDWDGADQIERRERILAAKYGNKTIVYPPLEEE